MSGSQQDHLLALSPVVISTCCVTGSSVVTVSPLVIVSVTVIVSPVVTVLPVAILSSVFVCVQDIRGVNPHLTEPELLKLAMMKVVEGQPHSRMWYRINASRALAGKSKLIPSMSENLRDVCIHFFSMFLLCNVNYIFHITKLLVCIVKAGLHEQSIVE